MYLEKAMKKLWNMKVTVIPISFGAQRTVSKGLSRIFGEIENRERIEFLQSRRLKFQFEYLKSPRENDVKPNYIAEISSNRLNLGIPLCKNTQDHYGNGRGKNFN